MSTERLTEAELEALIGRRDYQEFLNPRKELYRTQNMKEHPPSRAEAIQPMAQQANLIRRPVVIRSSQMVLGFDEQGVQETAEIRTVLAREMTKEWR